ncbi:10024_t:CDS:2, partial [Acaulospora morrowiae]
PKELEENNYGSKDMFEEIEYESKEVEVKKEYYMRDLSEEKVPTLEKEVEYTDEKYKVELDNLMKAGTSRGNETLQKRKRTICRRNE